MFCGLGLANSFERRTWPVMIKMGGRNDSIFVVLRSDRSGPQTDVTAARMRSTGEIGDGDCAVLPGDVLAINKCGGFISQHI